MNTRQITLALVASAVMHTLSWAAAPPQISVQGKLTDAAGIPVPAGNQSFTFEVMDAQFGGNLLWVEDQTIASDEDGLWSGSLGALNPLNASVFSDTVRWLSITVMLEGGSFAILPRVRLITGPYAHRVTTVDGASGGNITSKVTIGPGHTNTGQDAFVAGVNNVVIGDRSVVSGGQLNLASGMDATVGGGASNRANGLWSTVAGGVQDTAFDTYSTVGGGFSNSAYGAGAVIAGGGNNHTSGLYPTIAGGWTNFATNDYATVGGGRENQASGGSSVVAGGEYNSATVNSFVGGGAYNSAFGIAATIAGGYGDTCDGNFSAILGGGGNYAGAYATVGGGSLNRSTGQWASIGGGIRNRARGNYAHVGGGGGNTDADSNSAQGLASTIGGGNRNVASNNFATVSGGVANVASGFDACVGGGEFNAASGQSSVVPGGEKNVAGGSRSFAAGRQAQALHTGCFVWADFGSLAGDDFASTAENQFLIRASGGVGMGTNAPESRLHVFNGSAGTVTAYPQSVAAFETDTHGYLSLLTPAASECGILFGNPTNVTDAAMIYNNAAAPGGIQFRTDNNNVRMTLSSAGVLTVFGNVCAPNTVCPSDSRLKQNIHAIPNALEKVAALCGVEYEWTPEALRSRNLQPKSQIGVVAQQVAEIVPEAVHEMPDGYLGVDYARLVPLLIEGMKEQQKQIDELKSTIKSMTP